MKLNKWSTTAHSTPYMAPEQIKLRLAGIVDSHPKLGDCIFITTSPIIEINGRTITTKSGHIYKLGAIDPKYRKFLKKTKPNWNWRNPITFIGGDK